MLTLYGEPGRRPLVPETAEVLPAVLRSQVSDHQLQHGPILPQAVLASRLQELIPTPPLHRPDHGPGLRMEDVSLGAEEKKMLVQTPYYRGYGDKRGTGVSDLDRILR